MKMYAKLSRISAILFLVFLAVVFTKTTLVQATSNVVSPGNQTQFSNAIPHFQETLTYTTFLPMVITSPPPPSPPTISNLSSGINSYYVNECEMDNGKNGSELLIRFDFTDPNGNVWDSPNGDVKITFLPANDPFDLTFDDFYAFRSGTGYSGRVSLDEMCIRFGNQSSVNVTVSMYDSTSLKSNSLTVNVRKPAGVNRVSDQGVPAIKIR